jgi:hypothetical protein
MKRNKFTNRTLAVISAVGAMMFSQIVPTSAVMSSAAPAHVVADADVSAESRTLDAFGTDLDNFDKKITELKRKASFSAEELELHERTGNDLKRRVAGIQNALRDAIRKLKATGQWDRLDEIVLSSVTDARVQEFIRREGFRRILEETANSVDANEIVSPLDALRNRVRAQNLFESRNSTTLGLRMVRVSYSSGPVMANVSLRCRFALLRSGFSQGFSNNGSSSKKAQDAVNCQCYQLGVGCAPTT